MSMKANERGGFMSNSRAYCAGVVTDRAELEAVYVVRMTVFVEEQKVPAEEELDAYDLTATHFAAWTVPIGATAIPGAENAELYTSTKAQDVVGAARLVDKGDGVGKIGRVAVLAAHRGRGVGALLMEAAEAEALHKGFKRLMLEAQCYAIPFYEKLGYIAEGDVFLDCNIEHRLMTKKL